MKTNSFALKLQGFSQQAKLKSHKGQSLTRNLSLAFFLNSHLLPTCCFLPFLLSALCLVLPLS